MTKRRYAKTVPLTLKKSQKGWWSIWYGNHRLDKPVSKKFLRQLEEASGKKLLAPYNQESSDE